MSPESLEKKYESYLENPRLLSFFISLLGNIASKLEPFETDDLIRDFFDLAKEKVSEEEGGLLEDIKETLIEKLQIKKTLPQNPSKLIAQIIRQVYNGDLANILNSAIYPWNNADIKQIDKIQKILKIVFNPQMLSVVLN